jgi:hypothetical protein
VGAHRLRLDGDDTSPDSVGAGSGDTDTWGTDPWGTDPWGTDPWGTDPWGADSRPADQQVPRDPAAAMPVVPNQRSGAVWFGDDAGQYVGLRRRTPQSHLVPELRAQGQIAAARPALPPAHVTGAAQALSRFHAGRRAATDRGDGAADARPESAGAGAAWFEPPPSDAEPDRGAGR